jgi:hypothetical protein
LLFYCIEFRICDIDYYRIIGLLGIYSKNKIVLELYLKWLEKFRDDKKIDFGKYKGKYFYDLPYDYLIWLKENFVYKKEPNYILHLLLQHSEKCKEIFYNKEKHHEHYVDYFNVMKQKYNSRLDYKKIINNIEFVD